MTYSHPKQSLQSKQDSYHSNTNKDQHLQKKNQKKEKKKKRKPKILSEREYAAKIAPLRSLPIEKSAYTDGFFAYGFRTTQCDSSPPRQELRSMSVSSQGAVSGVPKNIKHTAPFSQKSTDVGGESKTTEMRVNFRRKRRRKLLPGVYPRVM